MIAVVEINRDAELSCVPESQPHRVIPVGSKYSCGALIQLEQFTESVMALDAVSMRDGGENGRREEQLITLAL